MSTVSARYLPPEEEAKRIIETEGLALVTKWLCELKGTIPDHVETWVQSEPRKAGMNFIQTTNGKRFVIHLPTFILFSLLKFKENNRGWLEFSYEDHPRLNKRNQFATVHPIKKT